MKRIVCKNNEELSRSGALMFAEQIWKKPDSVLCFASGGTPLGTYKYLAEMCKGGMVDFSRVTAFSHDEYYPISKANDHSLDNCMWKNLFSQINIDRNNVFLPNGGASDPKKACDEYEKRLASCGGIDMQLLGVGHNGHIAFLEPADELPVNMNVITLTDKTIDANSRFFDSRDDVPRQALSMGIGSVLSTRRIIVLISGKSKAAIVQKMFSGVISTQVPATLLQLHPNVVVILDEAAASLL